MIAGPESATYLIKKFVRRNRGLVAAVATILIVLITGIIVSTNFAIGQARASAESEFVTHFLSWGVLNRAAFVMGREATAVDVLNAIVATLDEGKLREKPLIEAQVRRSLSSTYFRLGDFKSAVIHQERVYDICREQLSEKPARAILAISFLAGNYHYGGMYQKAERLYEKAIELALRDKSGSSARHVPALKCGLAICYEAQGRYNKAEELLRTTLESDEWDRSLYPESLCMAEYGHYLADIYRNQGRHKEAEQMYLISLKNKDRRFPGKGTVLALNGLGLLRLEQGLLNDAEVQFKRGIEAGNSQLAGKGHPWKLKNVNGLAVLRTKQKQYEEAERLFQEALEGRILKLGEDHPETLESKNDLAILYKEQGVYDKAEPLLQEAIEGRRDKLGDPHPHTQESIRNLIDLYDAMDEPQEAEKWRAKVRQIGAGNE